MRYVRQNGRFGVDSLNAEELVKQLLRLDQVFRIIGEHGICHQRLYIVRTLVRQQLDLAPPGFAEIDTVPIGGASCGARPSLQHCGP